MLSIVIIRRLIEAAKRMLHRHQTRQRLLALDQQMLKDVGITRAEALEEGNKPFWR